MPKRREKLDDDLETILYFKESKEPVRKPRPRAVLKKLSLEGARSDIEEEPPMHSPKQVSTLECKWCVTMCCGDDCACAEQLMPQNITVLPKTEQPSHVQTLTPPAQSTTTYHDVTTEPESGRRGFSTRDYIKNVLTHDGDISSILNNLVKVTLQKVELMKKMDARRSQAIEYTDVEDSETNF